MRTALPETVSRAGESIDGIRVADGGCAVPGGLSKAVLHVGCRGRQDCQWVTERCVLSTGKDRCVEWNMCKERDGYFLGFLFPLRNIW